MIENNDQDDSGPLEVKADELLKNPLARTVEIPRDALDYPPAVRAVVSIRIPRAKRYRLLFKRPPRTEKAYIDGEDLPTVVPVKVEYSEA